MAKQKSHGYFKAKDCRWQRKHRNFQEQCFMLDLWAKNKFENYQTSLHTGNNTTGQISQKIDLDTKARQGYKNFISIEGDSHENAIQLLAHNNTQNVSIFSKLRPVHLSALVPTLKLYKVVYPRGKKKPFISIPFYFPSHLSLPAKDSDELKYLLLDNKPIGNVGIEGFDWRMAGTDPSSAQYDIQANLNVFMQQLSDLEYESPAYGKILSIIDSTEGVTKASYKDLLLPSKYRKGKLTAAGKMEPTSHWFKIRAEVGWAFPPNADEVFHDLSKEEIDRLRKAKRQTKRILTLNTVKHTITFNQDGSVKIAIQYAAAFENDMADSDSDIFVTPEIKKKIEEWNKFKESVSKKNKKIKKDLKTADDKSKKRITTTIKALTKEFKKREKDVNEFLNKSRAELYTTLIRSMEERGRVFDVAYDTAAIAAIWQDTSKTTFQQKAGKYSAAIRNKYIKDLTSPWYLHLTPNSNSMHRSATKKPTVKNKKQSPNPRGKKQIELNNPRAGFLSLGPKQKPKYQFAFFFLGDLIESAIEIAKKNSDNSYFYKNTSFLLGPVKYFDPQADKGKGAFVIKNLADIPISYELYRRWFNNKIVKPNKTSYRLRTFFKDIFSDFLQAALGGKCYDRADYTAGSAKVGLDFFTAKIKPSAFQNTGTLNRSLLTPKLIERIKKAEIIYGSDKGHRNFLFFYVYSNLIKRRRGIMKEDVTDGIFHFFIGSDVGILKSMNFQKLNWPGYAEGRMLQKSGFMRLGMPYKAQIKLVGLNYFKPGQYVYISPRRAGISKKIGRELMLEGYYIVLKASSKIASGLYETDIETMWQHHGEAIFQKEKTKIPKLPAKQPPRSASVNTKKNKKKDKKTNKVRSQIV